MYSNDAYGSAYMESLASHCAAAGIQVDSYAYEVGQPTTIERQVERLVATRVRVVMVVATGSGD
eukprot:245214-Prymnesium_polylepis.2